MLCIFHFIQWLDVGAFDRLSTTLGLCHATLKSRLEVESVRQHKHCDIVVIFQVNPIKSNRG